MDVAFASPPCPWQALRQAAWIPFQEWRDCSPSCWKCYLPGTASAKANALPNITPSFQESFFLLGQLQRVMLVLTSVAWPKSGLRPPRRPQGSSASPSPWSCFLPSHRSRSQAHTQGTPGMLVSIKAYFPRNPNSASAFLPTCCLRETTSDYTAPRLPDARHQQDKPMGNT